MTSTHTPATGCPQRPTGKHATSEQRLRNDRRRRSTTIDDGDGRVCDSGSWNVVRRACVHKCVRVAMRVLACVRAYACARASGERVLFGRAHAGTAVVGDQIKCLLNGRSSICMICYMALYGGTSQRACARACVRVIKRFNLPGRDSMGECVFGVT